MLASAESLSYPLKRNRYDLGTENHYPIPDSP